MIDMIILDKLAGMKNEELNNNTILSFTDEGKGIRINEIKSLNLSNTDIKELPEAIGLLFELQTLDVSGTQLISLPESIGNLSSLQSLDISGTKVTSLPERIGNLSSLQSLDISGTKVASLPERIGNLSSLRSLDISGTQVTSLPESIGELIKLSHLDIGGTDIKQLSSSLFGLPAIKSLVLEELSLDRIPKESLNTGLDFISQKRPKFAIDLKSGIYIHNLSLAKQPISLFHQKRELIEQYFREEMVPVNSVRTIFLGNGGVGKTYTITRLLNNGKKATHEDPYTTNITHDVFINTYRVMDGNQLFDIRLWDFGGQLIMHSLHRCFLTEHSCYVVILSTRTDRDLLEQARYWLRTVNSVAPNAPVIILINQWTNNPDIVDESRLREEFGNIKDFLYLSVVEADDESFLTLTDSILKQVRQMDYYGMEVPRSWYDLMTDLEYESDNYISKAAFFRMCFEKGLELYGHNNESFYELLLDWFNDLGVCFSYHMNASGHILDNYILLNPQWLIRAAYVLIIRGQASADNGILTKEQIEAVLLNPARLGSDDLGRFVYTPFEIEYILEILRKFGLSYQLPDGRELIPTLCRADSVENRIPEWFIPDEMQHSSYEINYDFLPETIIHRLMIYCYQNQYYVHGRWYKGMRVDLNNDGSITAVIDSGNKRQSITIDIYSDGRIPCWLFLIKFREEILQINTKLNLKTTEYIVIETDGIEDRFSVEAILIFRSRGFLFIPAENYDGDYDISAILESAYGPENTAKIVRLLESHVDSISVDSILNELISYDILSRPYFKQNPSKEERLNSFFQKYHDKCPTFLDLQQFVEEEQSDELQNYIHTELDDLYVFAEAQNTGRQASEIQELLELFWKLYLIESDHIKKLEVSDATNEKSSVDTGDENEEETSLPTNDRETREKQKTLRNNDDKEEQYKPKPSDLENATNLVLKDFEEWWERKADREGLTFSIEKHTVRQASGLQFGYDVGLNTRYGGLKYRLRFECKNYTSNISASGQDKTTELPVSRYAYNLLEYYMECKSEVNMRWVLICPFGGLQNDFPERLFEHWNEDHTFIKIYAIMENGPTLTCKDFLSVNDEAYRLVYKKTYDGDLTKDAVFEKLFKEIVGTDDVREDALKRLEKYTFWKEYGGHKGLLPVPDSKSQIALEQVISFLQRKKESIYDERKRTLFVVGEYGTGKSWLCYRAIEQIVLHPSDFPFMPFFLRLKDLSQRKDLEDMTQYKDIMQDTLGDFFEKNDGWAGECVKKDHQPVFFLDGFDEVFSGLSATDKKIDFLLCIIHELNDWYEKHEIKREIKKHTKPLFVITSRESDFEVGMKSEDFQHQMEQAEVIELELCSVEEVQKEWNKQEEEDNIDRSWIFNLEQNSAFLNIIRRPVFYRLCSDALKVEKFKQKVDLASVDEVDVLDMLFEYELQNYARGEGIDKNEIRKEIYRCAVKCSKEKRSQIVYEGKGINQIIHVGMVKIKKDQDVEGTCWISFEHNIVREYLTARYLSQSLIECPKEKTEDPLGTVFVKDLQELPLTPEALKFLLLCIEKKSPRDKGERYKNMIKKWLSDKSVKSLNSRLPARLLEILLQPGHTLSGESNEILDLSGLHASDLCLWNCGMQHVNLNQAELRNWQMINLELDDVDLRGANMEGLRVAPDKPISSFCYWKDTKQWHVAALHENGQLMQYSFSDNSWKHYSAEVLSKNDVNDGMFRFNKELILYSVKKLYDEKGNELYQIRSNNELDHIVTDSRSCEFITKNGNNYQATVFRRDMAPIAFLFGETKRKYLFLSEDGQVFYVQGGSINFVDENGKARKICDWANNYECFATHLDPPAETCLYIKCGDRLIRIALDEEKNEITAFRKELCIQGELETMRELRVLNKTALAAVGKNELYILSIEKNKDIEEVKSIKLKTAIVIRNSLLEDKDGRNRVQDNKAYELLQSSMC